MRSGLGAGLGPGLVRMGASPLGQLTRVSGPPGSPHLPWIRAVVAAPSCSICQHELQCSGTVVTCCHSRM